MNYVYVDAETASDVQLKVNKGGIGAYSYVEHPSTEVILWAIHMVGETRVYQQHDIFKSVNDFRDDINWYHEIDCIASWGPFDKLLVYEQGYEIDWLDLQQLCLTYGGPAKLEDAAQFFLGEGKRASGQRLITKFCVEREPRTGPDWDEFVRYAARDVELLPRLHAVFRYLESTGGHSIDHHAERAGLIDRINDRGVPIDGLAIDNAVARIEKLQRAMRKECVEICGFTPTQTAKLKDYLGTPNMQAETVEAYLLRDDITPEQRRVAEIQQTVAGAAHKKLYALRRMASAAKMRVRGGFTYHGAVTSRLTSQDAQWQNFKRATSDERYFAGMDRIEDVDFVRATRENIRGFVKTNRYFVAADFSAIECRYINWLAGEQWVLDLFAAGGDPYTTTADDIGCECACLGIHLDPSRQFGKACELGLGFGGGPNAVINSGVTYGLLIPEPVALIARDTYRRTHPHVQALWEKCEQAMRLCIAGWEEVLVNGKLRFTKHPWGVKLTRPSGFAQYFFNARVVPGTWPDGQPKDDGDIVYDGRYKSGRMITQKTYGGRIAQGATQGGAADLMYHGMLEAERHGFDPCMSIHDEGVFEIGEPGLGYTQNGDLYVSQLCKLMTTPMPNHERLPLRAEGWHGRRFTKA